MDGVTMQTQNGDERPVRVDDAVQSIKTKRVYAVVSIVARTGRPNLWAHGHRRIRNADPRRYRILEAEFTLSVRGPVGEAEHGTS